jgi:uncharacterized protein YfkK (UPF0435 family)
MVGYLLSRGVLYAGKFIKDSNSELYKIITVFFFVFASLFYLFLNKGLVYTSDLTGPQALLMQLKDKQFGVEKTLYVDRIELPLSLFYSDGPFVEIDFNPEKKDRVPSVDYKDALILLTKKGRFSEQVAGYEYKPQVVSENGDWVLWFMESRYLTDKNILQGIQERIKVINAAVLANETVSYQELEQLKQQETALVQKITLSLN